VCLEQESCFIFSLYVLGKSIKNVRHLIKNYQIESIYPVPYITLWQDFSECVEMFLHNLHQIYLTAAIQSNAVTEIK